MLNSKQRAQLRALGNGLDAVFQIGKGGINDQLIRQIDELLELKELVKLRVLPQCSLSSREAADKVAELVGADVVQVIGSRFILYKESRENKKIILVR